MNFSQEVTQDFLPISSAGQDLSDPAGASASALAAAPTMLPEIEISRLCESSKVIVVPATLVSLHLVTIPVKRRAHQLVALPFAVEEAIGRGVHETHHAICGTALDGSLIAAAIDRGVMEDYVQLACGKAILPEQFCLQVPEADAWAVYRNGSRTLVRCGDGTGFGCNSDALVHLWKRAGRPEIISYGDALPDGLSARAPVPADLGALDVMPDLRQGEFAPPQRIRGPLVALALCVVLAVVGHVGLLVLDRYRLANTLEQLQAEATALLADKLPDAQITDDPRLLQRRLTAGAPSVPQFLGLMSSVSSAMANTPVQVETLNYSRRNGALMLRTEAAEIETLQAAENALRAAGLRVTSGAVTAGDGSARVTLTVRSAP